MKNNFYKEINSFSKEEFVAPPKAFAPVYNWVWNGPVSHEETDLQLDEMQRLGIKAVCIIPEPKAFRPNTIPTLLEPDYLTAAYFEEYKYAVESAKKRQMHMWFYDEGGWPSGGACGKVMIKHPELACKTLGARNKAFKKDDVYSLPADALAAFLENGTQIEDGYVFECDCEITEYYVHCVPFESPGIPELPDLTREEATDAFLEETHEGYKPYLKEFFGDVLLTVFSDEPTGPRKIPFRKEIEELFEKENGYSIRPYLPELMGDKEVTDAGAKARIAWFDLCSRLFCNNYMLKEKEWTNKHNMAFIGHMDLDHLSYYTIDSGCYNVMRALRCFDMPGIDVIWRQIFPYNINNPYCLQKCNGNGIFPRYASSAAAQIGERHAITESMGVYGAGVTFDNIRYVLNFQAVRGINIYNIFGVPYERKGFLMMGELPYFTEKHACYSDLGYFNAYAERLSYLASLGEVKNDVAYYLPVADLCAGQKLEEISEAFEDIGNELEDIRALFDVADDDVFENADINELKTGKIVMGKACYTTVVIPPCKFMPQKTKDVLNAFISGGGRVIIISGVETVEIDGAIKAESAKDVLKSCLELSGDAEKIRLSVRNAENGKLYMLFNETDKEKTFTANMSEQVYILDAENGRIIKPVCSENGITLTLMSGQMAFLWQGDIDSFEDETLYENEISLEEFSFRRSDRFVIGEMEFLKEEIKEEEKPIALGEWADTVGKDFSGSGIYKTKFTLPAKNGKISIDLGRVQCSCEAFVNGESLGVLTMSPYVYEVDYNMLKDENILEIRVSNTAANEYRNTKSFDKWQTWQLTGFRRIQDVFHDDSLYGGLYGPVKIKY